MTAVALVLGGVVLALALAKAVTYLLVQRWSETLDFRGPVRAVEVTLGKGEVTVRGSDRRDARVRRRISHGLRAPRISEHVDDGVLRLEVTSGVVRYEVDVPAGAAVVVRGSVVPTTVIGMAGPVELRPGAGSLEGRNLAADHVSAVTSTGSIRLSFDAPPEVVDLTTGEGSIDLALPSGPYDVEAAERASVHVPCKDGARRRVRARSGHGAISIRHR